MNDFDEMYSNFVLPTTNEVFTAVGGIALVLGELDLTSNQKKQLYNLNEILKDFIKNINNVSDYINLKDEEKEDE